MVVQTSFGFHWSAPVTGEGEILKEYRQFIKQSCLSIHKKMLWHESIEDLEQEANMVLLRLIRTGAYDSTKRAGFKTFLRACLYNRFRTLALNSAKYRNKVKELPELSFQHIVEPSELEIHDLIDVLQHKVSETSRQILETRLSTQDRVTLSTLCEQLKCSMKTVKNATAELRRVFRELTDQTI